MLTLSYFNIHNLRNAEIDGASGKTLRISDSSGAPRTWLDILACETNGDVYWTHICPNIKAFAWELWQIL